MKRINLAISGCMGRMGQQIIKSSIKNKNFRLTTLTEYKLIKKRIAGIKPSLNDEHSLGNAVADQFANEALDKFEKNNTGILKYFQQSS